MANKSYAAIALKYVVYTTSVFRNELLSWKLFCKRKEGDRYEL